LGVCAPPFNNAQNVNSIKIFPHSSKWNTLNVVVDER